MPTRSTRAGGEMLGFTGESSAQAASFDWKKKAAAAAFVGASAAKKESVIARCALDQSSRYADLSLSEEQLIANGQELRFCPWEVSESF